MSRPGGAEPAVAPAGPGRPPLEAVPPTRRAILLALKRQGVMGVPELAGTVGLSVAATRHNLGRLADDGLVTHRSEPRGRGRPAHLYELAPLAEALFPKRYGDLTTELLGYLGGAAAGAVDDLFDQRGRRRLREAEPRLAGMTLDERVEELTRILDQDGYLAGAERLSDGWRIVEHNCAILSVAAGFSQACSSELAFLRRALPGARVERVAHRMDGAHVCAYRVEEVPSGSGPGHQEDQEDEPDQT
ncbi:MAG: helix-turn-helix transcriptional regulator [Acidimicrobiales bacterium]